MLKRTIKSDVDEFMDLDIYKSMLLLGVRQCGKTTLVKNYIKDNKNSLYINLEQDASLSELFTKSLDPKSILTNLSFLYDLDFDFESRITLVIDEIQVSKNAITSLKYFDECDLDIKVIGTGSLLGVVFNEGDFSFPVGKVAIKHMFPLTFDEYLINVHGKKYVDLIKKHFDSSSAIDFTIHEKLLAIFNEYLHVGSMPQNVATFIKYKSVSKIGEISSNINIGYQNDILKYIDDNKKMNVFKILDNVGNELLKENQKFKFSNIKSGLGYRELETSITWLENSNILYKCHIIQNKGIHQPLKQLASDSNFKFFYCDTNLLLNKMNYNIENIKGNDRIYLGVVIENFVATELFKKDKSIYNYNDLKKEIDFLVERDNQIIPIEVKAASNTRSKSLNSFIMQNDIKLAYRISSKNFGFDGIIKSIPIYATFLI